MLGLDNSLVIVISDLGGGGAQRVLMHMLQIWGEQGYNLTVITLAGTDNDFYTLPNEVERISLSLTSKSTNRFDGLMKNIYRLKSLRKALKVAQPHIVISFIGTTNILTIIASRFLNLKIVISERNDPSRQSLGKMWDFLRVRLYKFADIVTANSYSAINIMKDYVPGNKLMYVPNPVMLPSNVKKIAMEQPHFLAVGRLHSQKAYDVLINAVAASQMRKNGWKLSILGDGQDCKKLKKLSEDRGVNDLISWEGHVEDPYPYYLSSSIFIMTSKYEGMPNALLEAMSVGLPCIVSDTIDAVKELDNDGSIFKTVEYGNVKKLAKSMDELMALPDHGKSLGVLAKKQVLSCMSVEETILSWDKVFKKLDLS